jgi:hypothetical protein
MAMARVFTREQFYELVWSRPMTQLAKEFALSDVALHKICRKHGVPNPPLGWWAKKAAGKAVQQIPLPKAKPGVADKIIITEGDLSRSAAASAALRENARIRASGGGIESATSNPIIDRTLAKFRKSKASDNGLAVVNDTGLVKCTAAPASADRLAVILPRIVSAAALQGFDLVSGENGVLFKSETETVEFSISEEVKREKHVLTDSERQKEDAWQRKRDQAARRNSWDSLMFDRPRFPEWDYRPTGRLSIELEHVYVFRGTAPRRSLRDAKIQRLENMASDIGVGLVVLAAAKTDERLKREEQQRLREEERRRREQAARSRHIEERRLAGLGAILTELDELDRLRRLIAQLDTEIQEGQTDRLSVFLLWAKEHLRKREAGLSANEIEARFEAERLFGADDDHAFIPARW